MDSGQPIEPEGSIGVSAASRGTRQNRLGSSTPSASLPSSAGLGSFAACGSGSISTRHSCRWSTGKALLGIFAVEDLRGIAADGPGPRIPAAILR